jgi:cytochrome c553
MRRAEPPLGAKRRNPGEVRLQAMRPQARDAVKITEPAVVAQLQAFKAGARKNDAMSVVAPSLSDKDIEDLAAYFSAIEIKLPGE